MAGHLDDTRGGDGAAVEIRPGSIIGRAFDIYRGQAATLLGAAVIVFAIQFLLALLLPNSLLFIAGLAAFVVSIFYQGMVVNLVRDVQDGRRDHSMGELFSAVAPVALPLIGLAIFAGIAIAIGFVLLVIPGLILLTIWAVAAPVMVIEHPGVFTALGRSRELVRGYGWQVFGHDPSSSRSSRSRCTSSSGSSGSRSATRCGPSLNWIAATLTARSSPLTSSVLLLRAPRGEGAGRAGGRGARGAAPAAPSPFGD